MLNHRIRIFSSLLIAFVIVKIFANFTDVKNLLTNFKFPSFNFDQTRGQSRPTPTNILYQANYIQFNKPTALPIKTGPVNPTPTKYIFPTMIIKGSGNPTPTLKPTTYQLQPTTYIKPTKIPKPTATPAPPPITSDLRPGTNLAGIFQEVSKRMCFPPALLMAFNTEESWGFDYNTSATIIKIYNTYGWWINGTGNPCVGFGYHTATGIVPSDSVDAGTRCQNPIPGDDQGIMGIFQISQWEQDVSRKNTISTLPNNIDRRVLFDNALIFASITKNRLTTTPKSCTDWTDDEIRTVAEKHHGSCLITENSSGGNYCNDILRLYKQYR